MNADLHCHTELSDGTASVEAVVRLAKRTGLSALAITDHDTFSGVQRAIELGNELGITVVEGTEISSYDYKRKRNVHVLCYRPKHPERLSELLNATVNERKRAAEIMAHRLAKMFPITEEEFLSYGKRSTAFFKQHFMKALMDAGFSLSVFSPLYYELFRKRGEKYISEPISYPDVYSVIEEIKRAEGIAVIAHAGFYDNFSLIEELVSRIDGVEVWHPKNTPAQTEWLYSFATQNNLLKTGGSDYHGFNNTEEVPLGTYTAPDENLFELLKFDKRKD